VSVLIHDQRCAAETRRARKRHRESTPNRRVAINSRVCEGCGDCGRVSGCLSVQPISTPYGPKTAIDQASCNLDFSCLEGDCPSFMTVSPRPRWQRALRRLWRGESEDASARGKDRKPPSLPTDSIAEPTVRVANPDDFSARMTGIGGTGVVTVSQVLATAAAFDGFEVRGLDQIGLSQKAGPVVSDLRLRRGRPAETNRIGAGCADLLMAFDALAAASPVGLLVGDAAQTAVVGSTASTPTGEMITRSTIEQPDPADLRARIAGVTRSDRQHWADAAAITRALLGDSVTANIFVVGMAIQAGHLPIRADSVERAIELNGVAVESNRAAFRWGRIQIASPERIEAERSKRSAPVDPEPVPEAFARRIDSISHGDPQLATALRIYTRNLIDHQNPASADRFLATLADVARCESATVPGSTQLTTAVAAGLHKLMAYKDEYEVARLLLRPDGLVPAREIADRDDQISWWLHPPLLRAIGLRRKIRIGSWAAPLLAGLAAGRSLRGTPLDPFGWTRLRRIERSLPGEYCRAIERVLRDLKPGQIDDAIAIARLPADVRGYEDIKLANIRRYQQRLRELLDRFESGSDDT